MKQQLALSNFIPVNCNLFDNDIMAGSKWYSVKSAILNKDCINVAVEVNGSLTPPISINNIPEHHVVTRILVEKDEGNCFVSYIEINPISLDIPTFLSETPAPDDIVAGDDDNVIIPIAEIDEHIVSTVVNALGLNNKDWWQLRGFLTIAASRGHSISLVRDKYLYIGNTAFISSEAVDGA